MIPIAEIVAAYGKSQSCIMCVPPRSGRERFAEKPRAGRAPEADVGEPEARVERPRSPVVVEHLERELAAAAGARPRFRGSEERAADAASTRFRRRRRGRGRSRGGAPRRSRNPKKQTATPTARPASNASSTSVVGWARRPGTSRAWTSAPSGAPPPNGSLAYALTRSTTAAASAGSARSASRISMRHGPRHLARSRRLSQRRVPPVAAAPRVRRALTMRRTSAWVASAAPTAVVNPSVVPIDVRPRASVVK